MAGKVSREDRSEHGLLQRGQARNDPPTGGGGLPESYLLQRGQAQREGRLRRRGGQRGGKAACVRILISGIVVLEQEQAKTAVRY